MVSVRDGDFVVVVKRPSSLLRPVVVLVRLPELFERVHVGVGDVLQARIVPVVSGGLG